MRGARGRAMVGGVLVLVAGLTACGDGGSDASPDEFCEAFNKLVETVMTTSADDEAAAVRAVRDWAADMQEVGAPEDMPEDARHGFEMFVDQAADLDEDRGLDDLEDLGADLGEDDRADALAFTAWTQENCPIDR